MINILLPWNIFMKRNPPSTSQGGSIRTVHYYLLSHREKPQLKRTWCLDVFFYFCNVYWTDNNRRYKYQKFISPAGKSPTRAKKSKKNSTFSSFPSVIHRSIQLPNHNWREDLKYWKGDQLAPMRAIPTISRFDKKLLSKPGSQPIGVVPKGNREQLF